MILAISIHPVPPNLQSYPACSPQWCSMVESPGSTATTSLFYNSKYHDNDELRNFHKQYTNSAHKSHQHHLLQNQHPDRSRHSEHHHCHAFSPCGSSCWPLQELSAAGCTHLEAALQLGHPPAVFLTIRAGLLAKYAALERPIQLQCEPHQPLFDFPSNLAV